MNSIRIWLFYDNSQGKVTGFSLRLNLLEPKSSICFASTFIKLFSAFAYDDYFFTYSILLIPSSKNRSDSSGESLRVGSNM